MASRLLTAKETAERLGVAEITLAKWRSTGQGPAYLKVGRAVRYDPADLELWIEAQKVMPARS